MDEVLGILFAVESYNGSTWVSVAPGAVMAPVALDPGALSETPSVKSSDIVSVFQMGS